MRIGAWRFQPGLVPTIAAVAMVALTLWASQWQFSRAGEKAGRQAVLEARALQEPLLLTGSAIAVEELRYRRIRAEGRYLARGQVFIDNRSHNGRAGFHVITPLQADGGGVAVLVNRGWVARTSAYPKAPEVAVPDGRVVVDGLAAEPPARVMELSSQTVAGNVWQNLSIEKYRAAMKLDVLPAVLLAANPEAGFAKVEEKPGMGVTKHQEYALTWLSLAITVTVLWIALNLKRHR